MTLITINPRDKTPKYQQIIRCIVNGIEKGILERNQPLPSINEVSEAHDLARDTVERAYHELKKRGVIGAVRGKGYFVIGIAEAKLRVLLVLNKLSAYKKIIYYSFLETLGDKAVVDLHVHHYNAFLFKNIIEENLGKYHFYVVMPHFFEDVDKVNLKAVFQKIPTDELVLMDKDFAGIEGDYLAVYQDFERDIFAALESGQHLLDKYRRLAFVFPGDAHYPPELLKGFKYFCIVHGKPYRILETMQHETPEPGTAYIVIEESDLVEVIRKAKANNLTLGSDIGIISFNDTPLKEILAEGITVISTDFVRMGSTTAQLMLDKKRVKLKNPFSLIERKSL